jgi:DNA-binding LacI/PurR family transcriptional regulator
MGNFDCSDIADRRIIDLAYGGVVDGVILLAVSATVANGRSLRDCGLPLVSVFFDERGDGISSVVTNDREATREAVRHLLALGHRRFFYISAPPDNYHEVERYAGVCEELKAAGLGVDAAVRFEGAFDFDSGIAGARHYLSLDRRPTAAICCNDNMAVSFMKVVSDAGLRVPQDLSVVGFDGAELGAFCGPGLTTVRQPTAAMGRLAAARLLRLIAQRSSQAVSRKRKPDIRVENSTLVIRGSTGPAPR